MIDLFYNVIILFTVILHYIKDCYQKSYAQDQVSIFIVISIRIQMYICIFLVQNINIEFFNMYSESAVVQRSMLLVFCNEYYPVIKEVYVYSQHLMTCTHNVPQKRKFIRNFPRLCAFLQEFSFFHHYMSYSINLFPLFNAIHSSSCTWAKVRFLKRQGQNVHLLTHVAKGNVSFCHHLASGVRQLFTF